MEIGKLVAICFNGLTNALRQSLRPSRTELDAPAALIMAGLAAQWKSGDRFSRAYKRFNQPWALSYQTSSKPLFSPHAIWSRISR
jgi:hypothetical protein